MSQLGRKPSQIGDLTFNLFQVIFGDPVDPRTMTAGLYREPREIAELVQRKTEIAAPSDELQATQVFPSVDTVISCRPGWRGHQSDMLVIANRYHLDARRLRQLSDAQSLCCIHVLDPIGTVDPMLERQGYHEAAVAGAALTSTSLPVGDEVMENTVKIWRGISIAKCALLVALVLCCTSAFAQSSENEAKEIAVVELGGAIERSLTEGNSSFGPTAAVEFTPIEHWLEIEAGATPLFRRHSTEWSTDVLLKKPWTISPKFEFMPGVGPEWIHANEYGRKTNSIGIEAASDFMFWPSRQHKFGWYLEPAYDYKFGPGHEHSLGVSGGLLISIP